MINSTVIYNSLLLIILVLFLLLYKLTYTASKSRPQFMSVILTNFDVFNNYFIAISCMKLSTKPISYSTSSILTWKVEIPYFTACSVSFYLPSVSENIVLPSLVYWHYHRFPLNHSPPLVDSKVILLLGPL